MGYYPRREWTRRYFLVALLGMTAESVEPVISHWVPYLLSTVYAGALADRFDCRRLIQIAQGLLMLASLAWGALFLTGLLAAGARAARPASPVG